MSLELKVTSLDDLKIFLPLVKDSLTLNKILEINLQMLASIKAIQDKQVQLDNDIQALIDLDKAQGKNIEDLKAALANSTLSDEDKSALQAILDDMTEKDTKIQAVLIPANT